MSGPAAAHTTTPHPDAVARRDGGGRFRVVVADDVAELRTLSRHMLEADGRFEVVGVATDGDEAVDLVAEHRPDALLTDLAMPGSDGFGAIARVRELSPQTKIVVLTGIPSEQVRDRVAAAGADACLEKGTSYHDLLVQLVDICSGDGGSPQRSDQAGGAAAPGPVSSAAERDGPDGGSHPLLATAARTDVSMRRLRWIGAAFAVAQFALYVPPPGVEVPFPQVATGAGVAAWLAAVNAASIAAGKRLPAGRLQWWRAAELVADAATVLAVVWLFAFDPTSALWALLVVPVLQGAKRGQLRGALLTWAGLSAGYVLKELWAAQTYPDHAFLASSVTYRVGIVGLVAVAAGTLARQLTASMLAHAEAAEVARRRAGLLRSVVTASRAMGSVDADKVLAAALDGAVALGFETVEVCAFESPAGAWRTVASRALPDGYRGVSGARRGGIAGKVWDSADVVVVEQYSAWPDGVPEMQTAGFGMVVAVPVFVGGQLVAALIAGRREPGLPGPAEVECLSLLASQAGVAMRNAAFVTEIGQQAFRDPLTGLPNRLLFEDRLRVAVAKASRTGDVVGVVFADIDGFKEVNDVLGHEVGNRLLQQVAGRLLARVRAADTVARVGGDEFAVVLDGLRDAVEARKVAAVLADAAGTPFLLGPHQVVSSLSLGLATHPIDGGTYEELVRRADARMYEAKAAGRGGATAAGRPRRAPSPTRLEGDLRRALDAGAITVAYQPQVDLRSGRIVGVEALARWEDTAIGAVEPSQFIPVAEASGLIHRVDLAVVAQACVQAERWRAEGFADLTLAVNLSVRDLYDDDVVAGFAAAVARSRFPVRQVEVELTESWAPRDPDRLRGRLEELKDLGVRLALDDFGSGCANLVELRAWPVDTVKIDGALVTRLSDSDSDRAILKAVTTMAEALGLRTVAEHVETADQLALLREHGCDLAQGHLFAPALPPAQVAAHVLLSHSRRG